MLFLTPISGLVYLFVALITGIIAWLVLWLLMKKRLSTLRIFLIFLIAFISAIIFESLWFVLEPIFNWAMPWHYNYWAPFQIFAIQVVVLFLYYFILFALLFDAGRRNAFIASIICTVTIPIFLNLGWGLVIPFL